MGRIQYIETSQEWICPQTGLYKVICVGGGGGGYSTSGGTTSFGAYLSAKGGISVTASSISNYDLAGIGGEGGYTVNGVYGGNGAALCTAKDGAACCGISAVSNGGNSTVNGSGYGAGGGSSTSSFGTKGELKADILTLAKDDVVACTVGTGGKVEGSGNAGNDGVIIIEFLSAEA